MILFLTRKFPPQRGGMETFSYELTSRFQGAHKVIHHGKEQRDVFWALPLLLLRGLLHGRSASLFHLGDLVLAPLAPILRHLTHRPIVVTVHALELLYNSAFLQRRITAALPSVTHFVAVSTYTKQLLLDRGVDEKRISVIPHGVDVPEVIQKRAARQQLNKDLDLPVDRPIILTVGRLVKRKGVAWFTQNVLPSLSEFTPLYVVTSTGPDRDRIRSIARDAGVEQQLRLLGKVSDEQLRQLYTGSDVFAMPNIPVEYNAEGFGFVAIEAASYGLPVIASRLEGIPEAIHHGKNGILIEPGNATEFTSAVVGLLEDESVRIQLGHRAREYTKEHFRWDDMVQRYKTLFDSLISA